MPHSENVEKSTLGAMILSDRALSIAAEQLKEEDFHIKENKIIFISIIEVYKNSNIVDMTLLIENLESKNQLYNIGGKKALAEISSFGLRGFNIEAYIETLKDRTKRRKLINAAIKIQVASKDFSDGVDALSIAEEEIYNISAQKSNSGLVSVAEGLEIAYEQMKELSANPDKLRGVPTGFKEIDSKTNGFQDGDFILIAARPSMGKSSLALNIAQHAAIKENKNVCVFSLEMETRSLIYRMIASELLIPLGNILSFNLSDKDWSRLAEGIELISRSKLFIDDTSGISIMALKSKLRRHIIEHGKIDMIVIDYLQLMDGGSSENRQLEISKISRGLKEIAKEFSCPVVAASQLSRSPEARKDKRPMLSDLRESGAIEQDADLVMFIYRDDYYNEDTPDKNISEIIISKQRNGETGTIKLTWLGKYTKFANLAREF